MSNKIKKLNLFGLDYAITNYEEASNIIIEEARKHKSYAVSALAVHGLITAVKNQCLLEKINNLDMVVPDGQPVKWALNAFYKCGLKDRVYGPTLTLNVLHKANINKYNIYLYGSRETTLSKFKEFINKNYPNINICGIHIDRFRDSTKNEDEEDIKRINKSNAHIVLVGRGCPKQEIWISEHKGSIKAVMIAIGAAFDFHAGTVKQAPKWMQDRGLEWFFRLIQEPKRLWKRYLFTNSQFIFLFLRQKFFLRRPY